MSQPASFSNRLAHEASLYLRQHAHNPVDWYPWGPEALERARRLDRPIFLSIGYSACHWCHVMEHESFEDPEVGRILNEHFVPIKVDREERPDLDQVYMTAVQLLTGQGGWPMSMFLTPDQKPFFGGTYFPPDERHGRPSFKRVLLAVATAWKERRQEVVESSGQIAEQVRIADRLAPGEGELPPKLIEDAALHLGRAFDRTYGGFGSAPKFPHPMDLRLLLRAWKRFGNEEARDMTQLTLEKMAAGGIYDHLGGGFHRYSTDARWLVPHFEKMLYDNALLAVTYLEGYQALGDPLFREVVEETLGYVLREMTSPAGPFFSTQDADSEGEEGKFYVWSEEEIVRVLGPELADLVGDVYGLTPGGNWEGHTILSRAKTLSQVARLRHTDEADLRRRLGEARRVLYEARSRRVWPTRDEKILTAWNGLVIDALAQAAAVLQSRAFAAAADRAADFLLRHMRSPDGRLLRTCRVGSPAKLNGYLEDYSFLINGLVSLYEATFAPARLEQALELVEVMIEDFWDPAEAGFFYTGRHHETLLARNKDPHDSSLPSGNSMAVTALLRLGKLTGRLDLKEKARATLHLYRGLMRQSPLAAGQMLIGLDFCLGPTQEFAVVGETGSQEVDRVLRAIFGRFRPNKVVALKAPGEDGNLARLIPLLAGKTLGRTVSTYVCEDFACRAPLEGAEAAEAALNP